MPTNPKYPKTACATIAPEIIKRITEHFEEDILKNFQLGFTDWRRIAAYLGEMECKIEQDYLK